MTYETVTDSKGNAVDYDAAVALMDDDLREELHSRLAECSAQEFYDAYLAAHKAKYNEDFAA